MRLRLLLILVFFCASGLFDHSLWTPNDSREGGMIAEMYRTGHWAELSLNGEPFLEKPPLLHWSALVLCSIFGHVGAGLIRVPAAVFGLLTALIVWHWGRRLGSEPLGVLAAFLCVTNITYYEYSRIVLTDICLTFMVAISLEAFWSAHAAENGKPWRYALFLLAASLSFYAKGLIGPVFVVGSVTAFFTLNRLWKPALVLPLVFAAVLLAVVGPWAAALYRDGGREYVISAFIDNQLGRFFTLPAGAAMTSLPFAGRWLGFLGDRPVPFDPYYVHREPIYYYLLRLPIRLLPWTFLVPPALLFWFKRGRTPRSSFASFLGCALVTMAVILHLASSKAGNYALPLFPILFLMVGYWCEASSASKLPRFDTSMMWLTSRFVRILTVAVPALYLALFSVPRSAYVKLESTLIQHGAPVTLRELSSPIWAPGSTVAWLGAALSTFALVLALWSIRRVDAHIEARDFAGGVRGLAATIAIVVMLAGTAAMPAYDHQRTYEPIAELVRAELDRGRRVALASRDSQIVGEFAFYAGQRLPIVDPIPGVRAFLDAGSAATGVVVRGDELQSVDASLQGLDHEVRTVPESAGYNAREFCLITRHETQISPSSVASASGGD